MGQVAFNTQEFVETLEKEGLPKNQVKAISIAVRKSHEAVDVATKRDLDDVRKEIDIRFDKVDSRFEKIDAQITEVRKDLYAEMNLRFEKVDAHIAEVHKDLSTEITNVRKDMENRFDTLGLQLTMRIGGMLILAIGTFTTILKLVHQTLSLVAAFILATRISSNFLIAFLLY